MTTTTHSHKAWIDKGGHVNCSLSCSSLGRSEESSLTQSTLAHDNDFAQANCFKEVLPLEL